MRLRSTRRLSGGSVTRLDTGDLSICGSTWSSRANWRTLDPIGNSDHIPIEVTINTRVDRDTAFMGAAKWKTKDVTWGDFTKEIEAAIPEIATLDLQSSINTTVKSLNKIITDAARKTLGKTKPGKRRKTWETREVREAIKTRNRLRLHVRTKRREWLDACRAAQVAINEAKANAWRQALEDASSRPDGGRPMCS